MSRDALLHKLRRDMIGLRVADPALLWSRLDAILAEPALPWVSVGDRLPTKADADSLERVMWAFPYRKATCLRLSSYKHADNATHWCGVDFFDLPEQST